KGLYVVARCPARPGKIPLQVAANSQTWRDVAVLWPRVFGQRGLYRPRELFQQLLGRGQVLVKPLVGSAVVERHGDPDSVSFRQTWDCDRKNAAAELPRILFPKNQFWIMGCR